MGFTPDKSVRGEAVTPLKTPVESDELTTQNPLSGVSRQLKVVFECFSGSQTQETTRFFSLATSALAKYFPVFARGRAAEACIRDNVRLTLCWFGYFIFDAYTSTAIFYSEPSCGNQIEFTDETYVLALGDS